MFFERSQQRFLLISRNNIIGNFKKNRILFLDMLPQKPNVGLCLIDKNFLSNLVFRLHEGNRRKHQSYKTSSLFVFHQHHTDWTSVSRYAAFLHGRKENLLFLKMMALVGKMTEEIQRFLPTVQGLLHGSSRELFQHGKHALDDSVLIAKQFRGFLGMMMCATAWSLGHMRRVNALWLVRFNSIFHNFFSSPVMQLALSVLHMKTRRSFGVLIHHRTTMKTCKIGSTVISQITVNRVDSRMSRMRATRVKGCAKIIRTKHSSFSRLSPERALPDLRKILRRFPVSQKNRNARNVNLR